MQRTRIQDNVIERAQRKSQQNRGLQFANTLFDRTVAKPTERINMLKEFWNDE